MKAKIKVIRQEWTGWTPQQPEPQENIMEVGTGDSLILTLEELGNPSLVVKDIGAEAVTVISSNLAPKQDTGTINLNKDYSNLETVLKIDETVELGTQTMDAGVKYVLTLIEIV